MRAVQLSLFETTVETTVETSVEGIVETSVEGIVETSVEAAVEAAVDPDYFFGKRSEGGHGFRFLNPIPYNELKDYEGTIWFPYCFDSEYVTRKLIALLSENPGNELDIINDFLGKERKIITVQVKVINDPSEGKIYAHQDIGDIARHQIFEDCAAVEYLREITGDPNIEIERIDETVQQANKSSSRLSELKTIVLTEIAFLGPVDYTTGFTGQFKQDLIQLSLDYKKDKTTGITFDKRLKAVKVNLKKVKEGRKEKWVHVNNSDYVFLPWTIKICGEKRRVAICYFDMVAVNGATSYKGFCKNSGVDLPYKDWMDDWKERMDEGYLKVPHIYDPYSLGDLNPYEAYLKYCENMETIHREKVIPEYFREPRLTLGATTANLFKACAAKIFKVPKEDINKFFDEYCREGTAKFYSQQLTSTAWKNAKVFGGLCNNAVSTHIRFYDEVYVDLDIPGAYQKSMEYQLYPIGNPQIWAVREGEKGTIPLGTFIKRYGKDFVDSLYQIVVSTEGELRYGQNFLVSWVPPKKLSILVESDYDDENIGNWLENQGIVKLFTHSVENAVITSDVLNFIEASCSHQQKSELYKKLKVQTAVFYPKKFRVKSPEELLEKWGEFESSSSCSLKDGEETIKRKKCPYWYAVNLGDTVTNFLGERRSHYPAKTPLNYLYKTLVNASYGVQVTDLINSGNCIIGNNITAKVRIACAQLNIAVRGIQSITDGVQGNLNRVLHHARRDITPANSVCLHRNNDDNLKLGPLGGETISLLGFFEVEIEDKGERKKVMRPRLKVGQEIINESDSHDWIVSKVLSHIEYCFPNMERVFGVTVKGVFDKGAFHGSSNYLLINPTEEVVSFRSYQKKELYYFTKEEGLVMGKPPSGSFLRSLLENPRAVPRTKPFVKSGIIKLNEYRQRYEKFFSKTSLEPGDNLFKRGLFREFSLSQFLFRNSEQYQSWEKEHLKLKSKYEQSYEMFFLNDDGCLNFEAMTRAVDTAIGQGAMGLLEVIDPHRNRPRLDHPYKNDYLALTEYLAKFYTLNKGEEEVDPDLIASFMEEEEEVDNTPQFFEGPVDLGDLDWDDDDD